ncbi:MAG: hypothetical protein IPG45_36950 [Deltaproteobacteria bacterium]|nr:hypothetical protein [Deltaproteobacteria bacterium]
MARWQSGVALLCTLVLSACQAFERWQGPPLKQGSVMTYAVTETTAEQERAYTVRFAFIGTADDRVAVQVKSERAERTIKLEKDLAPVLGERLEITLSGGQKIHPERIWLIPEDRQAGKLSGAGMVGPVQGYKEWRVVPVERNDEEETGILYFEMETGLLVGFHFTTADTELLGTLIGLR